MHSKKSASFVLIALGLILVGLILSASAGPVLRRNPSAIHPSKRFYRGGYYHNPYYYNSYRPSYYHDHRNEYDD
ncbi:9272_t:CDS:1, partial [Cetraspora pellucida]